MEDTAQILGIFALPCYPYVVPSYNYNDHACQQGYDTYAWFRHSTYPCVALFSELIGCEEADANLERLMNLEKVLTFQPRMLTPSKPTCDPCATWLGLGHQVDNLLGIVASRRICAKFPTPRGWIGRRGDADPGDTPNTILCAIRVVKRYPDT